MYVLLIGMMVTVVVGRAEEAGEGRCGAVVVIIVTTKVHSNLDSSSDEV